MAQRRMFSLKVVDTDAFMDMPLSAQALYFHLGMRADDDGFVSNARRVQKLVGAADDDLKILLLKRFVMTFDSGVIVIKHWRLNNYVKGDRYTPTLYQEEKGTLYVKGNGVYTDHPLPPPLEVPVQISETACIQNGSILDTQVREGKVSVGKGSLGKFNNYILSGDGDGRTAADEAVIDYLNSRGLHAESYLGVYEDALVTVNEFAKVVFQEFACRQPNRIDYANIFLALRDCEQDPVTKEWLVKYPMDKQNLLLYAFEQSARAGRPADWNYIEGVLKNLSQRGITTLAQAEQYDEERKG